MQHPIRPDSPWGKTGKHKQWECLQLFLCYFHHILLPLSQLHSCSTWLHRLQHLFLKHSRNHSTSYSLLPTNQLGDQTARRWLHFKHSAVSLEQQESESRGWGGCHFKPCCPRRCQWVVISWSLLCPLQGSWSCQWKCYIYTLQWTSVQVV